jgi:hypothetical protein
MFAPSLALLRRRPQLPRVNRLRPLHHNAPESSQPQVERERRAALARVRVLPASIVDSERGEPYFALLPP